jgi:energy-coupling factor transporter transmembrane protein EcfT
MLLGVARNIVSVIVEYCQRGSVVQRLRGMFCQRGSVIQRLRGMFVSVVVLFSACADACQRHR